MLRTVIFLCALAMIIAVVCADEKETAESDHSNDANKTFSDSNSAPPSSSPSSCSPYPEGLKSLEECCSTPILFADDIVGTCEFMCSENKKNGDDPDCPIKCLFINNGIMRKHQINRTALEVTYDRFGLANPAWRNITSAALDSCPIAYEQGKSFQDAFNVFEKCMTTYYQQHCIVFKPPTECDKVEDFMLKCQNFQDDCSVWPKWIIKLPEFCCDNPPQLFSSKLRDEGTSYCDSLSEVSNLGKMQCLAIFLLNVTGIKAEGKWNYDIALKNLKASVSDDAKWSKAIESTMEVCKKEVEDDVKAEKTEAYTAFWFYECVKGSLADFCPHYAERKECRRLTRYKEACPAAVPPRKLMCVNGKM